MDHAVQITWAPLNSMQLKNSIESNSLPIVYAISYRIACFTLRQATLTSSLSVRPSVHSSAVDKFADSATSSSHVSSVCPLCRCLTVYCGGAAPVPHLVTGSQWLPDIQVLLSRSHCTKRICISLLLKWFCIAAKATWRKRRNKNTVLHAKRLQWKNMTTRSGEKEADGLNARVGKLFSCAQVATRYTDAHCPNRRRPAAPKLWVQTVFPFTYLSLALLPAFAYMQFVDVAPPLASCMRT